MNRVWFPMFCVVAAGGMSLAVSAPARFYERHDLLSDGSVPAPNVDASLVNPWGLAFSPAGPFCTANEGTGSSSTLFADGSPAAPTFSVPGDGSGRPTGIVFNPGGGFEIGTAGKTASSRMLFVGLEGCIFGWNPDLAPHEALVAVDLRASGAVYTGTALAEDDGQPRLFVANFGEERVDVFDSDFALVDSFTNTFLPFHYAPFGIAAIGGEIFVTYVQRDPVTGLVLPGPERGFIDIFRTDGTREGRLAGRGELNAPWGLAVSPNGWGRLGNKMLVGNFGDGRILAYGISNGHFRGALTDQAGDPIVIPGILGIAFGNGGDGGETDRLYYTAGLADEKQGVFGEIVLAN